MKNGQMIIKFVRNLNDKQLDKLMDIMDKYSMSTCEAVVFGYELIKGV